ncbi:hypothetical protein CDL15_Pgr014153 [Punica granatum]|uniref:Uncharacterized protein n=1 Tax=Punica granatum TaxID=22663 RepID=A0A218XI23_PUNGR|nr:hypothetical protein CDL15_Pgr014153 [Punica granatum]
MFKEGQTMEGHHQLPQVMQSRPNAKQTTSPDALSDPRASVSGLSRFQFPVRVHPGFKFLFGSIPVLNFLFGSIPVSNSCSGLSAPHFGSIFPNDNISNDPSHNLSRIQKNNLTEQKITIHPQVGKIGQMTHALDRRSPGVIKEQQSD